jgi:hypothetical protein
MSSCPSTPCVILTFPRVTVDRYLLLLTVTALTALRYAGMSFLYSPRVPAPSLIRRRRGASTPATTPPPMECSDEDGEPCNSQPKGTALLNAPKRANTLPSQQVLRLTVPELDIRMVSVSEPISEPPMGFHTIKTFKFVDPNGKSHDQRNGVKAVKPKPRKSHKRSKMEIRVQPCMIQSLWYCVTRAHLLRQFLQRLMTPCL